MADNLNIRGKIDIDAGPAQSALRQVSENFVKVATSARSTESAVSKASVGLRNAAAAAKAEAQALAGVAKAQADVNKKYQEARLISAKATGANVATRNSKAVAGGQVTLLNARAAAEGIKAQSMAEDTASKVASRNLRDQIALRRENERAQRRINAAQEEGVAQLASTRYALFDVARGFGVVGAAMLALPVMSLTVAVAWERDFARVQRTFGGTSVEVENLRQDFVALVQTIPEDWGALTEIGTLAGQLGIAGPQIAGFTKIVAQFSTTTGVSVDETATAFGRLNSLVPDVNGNYKKLADSVLSVGVNSVATEQQILKISTQLSFLGSQTTFTSGEIIGLAGALASVGVPPELSRGLVARVFGTISRAISDGGSKLEKFGKIAGISGDEFATSWNADAGATFLKFMQGIQREGSNAEAAIRALGITSIRDVPVLIRLANAADSTGKAGALIAQTFRDASEEIASGELARQYEIQASTIAAKIQLLINNFQALLNVGGSGGLGFLGVLLDTLTNRLQEIMKFASTDFGGNVIGFGLILSGIAGALALVGAAAATSVAGYMALILALKGLQAQAGGATISMGSLNAMLASTGPLGVKAAAAIRLVGTALKVLGGVGIALVLPDVAKWSGDAIYNLLNVDKTFQATLGRFKNSQAFKINIDNDFMRGLREAGEAVGYFAYDGQRDLQRLEDGFKELAAAGELQTLRTQMMLFMDETGYGLERTLKEMPGLKDAFKEAGIEVKTLSTGALDFVDSATGMGVASGEVTGDLDAIEQAASASADAIKEAANALLTFNGAAMTYAEAGIALQTAFNNLADAGKEAGVSIDGTNTASLAWQQSLIDTEKAARNTAAAGIDTGNSAAYATTKYNEAREAIIKEIAAKTGSMDKARAWADAILGTADEAAAGIQNYSDTVKAAPTTLPLTVKAPTVATTNEAIKNLIYSADKLDGKVINIYTKYAGTGTLPPGISGPPSPKTPGFSGGQFYEGGFTGIGGKYQPAGVVHKGEYVMPAYSVAALGTSYFDNIRRATQNGYATGGSVSGVTQASPSSAYSMVGGANSIGFTTLDAQSINAFVNALSKVNLALYTTDRKIAESASRGAQEQTLIGSM